MKEGGPITDPWVHAGIDNCQSRQCTLVTHDMGSVVEIIDEPIIDVVRDVNRGRIYPETDPWRGISFELVSAKNF